MYDLKKIFKGFYTNIYRSFIYILQTIRNNQMSFKEKMDKLVNPYNETVLSNN